MRKYISKSGRELLFPIIHGVRPDQLLGLAITESVYPGLDKLPNPTLIGYSLSQIQN